MSKNNESIPNYFYPATESGKTIVNDTNEIRKKPRTGYICKRCHSDQHFFKDCPHQQIEGERPKYICHICHEPGHKIQDCPKKLEKGTLDKSTPGSCWFCLANPAIKKHLIVNIGDETYLTIAKGGVIAEHFILIPIEHHSSTLALSESHFAEINRFIDALRCMNNEEFLVFYHRQNPQHHLHLQALAIPSNKLADFDEFLADFSKTKNYEYDIKIQSSLQVDSHSFECFLTSDKSKVYHFDLSKGEYFPASYGRELAATFLNLAERVDWRLSPLTEEEEKEIVTNFKSKLTF